MKCDTRGIINRAREYINILYIRAMLPVT